MTSHRTSPIPRASLARTLASALFGLCAAALLFAGGLFLLSSIGTHRDAVAGQQRLLAHDAARSVNRFIEEHLHTLKATTWVTDLYQASADDQQQILGGLLARQPAWRWLMLLDEHEQLVARRARLAPPTLDDLAWQYPPADRIRVREQHSHVGTVSCDPVTGEPRVLLAVPVRDDFRNWKGVLLGDLNLEYVREVIGGLQVGNAGHAFVVSRDGTLIACADASRMLKGENLGHLASVAEFTAGTIPPASRGILGRGLTGERVVGFCVPLGTPDCALIIELPLREAYRGVKAEALAFGTILLLVSGVAGFVGVRVARRLASPLVSLTEVATRIAGGERQLQVNVGGPREVRRLAEAFNSMTGQLRRSVEELERRVAQAQQAEAALRQKSEELDRYFTNALDLLCIADTDGRFRRLNKAWETVLGYPLEELQGMLFLDCVHPDDLAATQAALRRLAEQETVLNFVNRYRCKNGDYRWIEWRSLPVGNLIYAAARDITERKRAESQESQMAAILAASLNEIYLFDARTLRFLYLNEGALRNLGYTLEQALTLTPVDIKPEVTEASFAALVEPLRRGEKSALAFETTHRRADGTVYPVEVHLQLFERETAAVFLAVIQDISERHRAEAALRESERRYALAQKAAHIGSWEWNIPTGELNWSEQIAPMFGLRADEFTPSYQLFLECIHPDDRAHVVRSVNAAVEAGADYSIEHRIIWPNGTVRWVSEQGEILREHTGKPVRMFGVVQDITERKCVEEALRESEHKFRAVLENAPAVIFMLDGRGVFRLSEGLGLNALGLRPGQVVGQSALEIYRDTPSILEGIRRALGGESYRTINRLGENFFDTVYSPYVTPDGRQNGVVGVAMDITERARAEAAFKESQERLALALEGANLGSWDWNIPTGETRVNERWAQMLGYRPDEITPHVSSWETLVHPDDLPCVREVLQAHLDGRTPFYATEHRMRHKSGHWIWVLDRGKVISRDAAGNPLRAAGTHLDITERKTTEAALERERVFTRAVLDSVPGLLYLYDDQGRLVRWNKHHETLTGYGPDELSQMHVMNWFRDFPEDAARIRAALERIPTAGHAEEEARLVTKDGRAIPFLFNAVNLMLEGRRYFVGVGLDLTERKRAETALRESEERFRHLFEHSRAVMVLIDPESGAIAEANPAAAGFYGYPREKLRRMVIEDINMLPPSQVKAARRRAEAKRSDEFEFPHRLASGELRTVEVRSSPVNVGGRRLLFSIIQDITERKRAEAALAEERELLHTVINLLPDGVYAKDRENRFLLVNQTLINRFGRSRAEELLGRTDRDFFPPDAASRFRAQEERVLAGDSIRDLEERQLQPDGQMRTLLLTMVPLRNPQGNIVGLVGAGRDITERKKVEEHNRILAEVLDITPAAIMIHDFAGQMRYANRRCLEMHGWTEAEFLRLKLQDLDVPESAERIRERMRLIEQCGEAAFEVGHFRKDRSVVPVMINVQRTVWGGEPVLLSVGTDISERKQTEQERELLIRELEAKNAELERFTYTVSHDLKSPLITIKGFAGALIHDVSKGRQDRVADDLKRIAKATDKMAELLNDLLKLSRIGRMMNPPTDVDLSPLLREVVELLAGPASQRQVNIAVQPGLPVVRGDRHRLLEVFQNLIENGIRFMGTQTQPRIEIGMRAGGSEPVFFVRDNGMGIEPRHHETVFGLFNKLDGKTAGTGIGLALVRRIIEIHGGRIWVESKGQGCGTTFCFTLPPHPPTTKEIKP